LAGAPIAQSDDVPGGRVLVRAWQGFERTHKKRRDLVHLQLVTGSFSRLCVPVGALGVWSMAGRIAVYGVEVPRDFPQGQRLARLRYRTVKGGDGAGPGAFPWGVRAGNAKSGGVTW
jgi:hypothetical protein